MAFTGTINEHSIHFIGGQGTGAGGSPTGGGCTKAEWENVGGINQTLSNIMDTNGEPICDGTTANATDNGSGSVRLTRAIGDSFTGKNVKVGTIVYVNFAGIYTDGYYIITAVGSVGDDIDINQAFFGNQAGNECYVGGAFQSLQQALDDIPDADGTAGATFGSRWIYSNKDETLAATVNVSVIDGDKDEDAHIWIKGFNTVPEDMDVGKIYDGTYVDIDGDNNAFAVFDLNANENIHIWNFYAHNVATGTDDCFEMTTCVAIEICNCKSNDARYGIRAEAPSENISVRDCIFDGGLVGGQAGIRGPGASMSITNCLFKSSASFAQMNIGSGIVSGCIFIGSVRGIQSTNLAGHLLTICNNTFYNQTANGITMYNGVGKIYNNIFYLAAIDDYAVEVNNSTVGSVMSIYNNCAYSAGGALTNPYYHIGKSENLEYEDSNIFEDPQFIDAVGGDFTPENWACMELGVLDTGDNPSHMGAIGKPSAYDIIVAEGV